MEDKVYWFITVFEDFDSRYGIKGSRTWGFYSNKEEALKTLKENRTDLWEHCYDYAVLEAYHEGVSGYDFEEGRQFFIYNETMDAYLPMSQEPEEVKYYVSFAIG